MNQDSLVENFCLESLFSHVRLSLELETLLRSTELVLYGESSYGSI
jgi:hypothetical protein